MTLFDIFKIPTFDGVNKNPIEPTAESPSNGSFLIDKYNKLIDAINLYVSPRWGCSIIYINGSTGDDADNGLSSSTPIKTQTRLIELIGSKSVDDILKINCRNITLTTLDLANVKFGDKSHLYFYNDESNSTFYFDAPDYANAQLHRNNFDLKEITFYKCNFNVDSEVRVSKLEGIEIANFKFCKFNPVNGHDSRLLNISKCQESIISGNSFFGVSTSAEMLRLNNIRYSKIYDNYFYDSTGNTVRIDGGSSYLSGYNNFFTYNYNNKDPNLPSVVIVNSNVKYNKYTPPDLDKISVISGNIEYNRNKKNIKSYTYFIPTLTDKTIILLANSTINGAIDKLDVIDDNSTAVYDILLSGIVLNKTTDTDKNKVYDLKDSNNKLASGDSKTIQLQITGTANDISIKIDVWEF